MHSYKSNLSQEEQMKLFSFRKKKDANEDSDNGILGLKYLEDFTEPILNPKGLKSFEWRRRLISKVGNTKFKIRYYGDLHDYYKTLITATEYAPQKVIAIDTQSGERILIFDGCKHGYNAMLCDEYTNEQIESRQADKIYRDKDGNEEFEIIISAYYQIDYEGEFRKEVDDDGKIELLNGEKIDFEELKRNGCDFLQVWGVDSGGKKVEIISEELA
ncbi:MAG: hypothetical protein ACFB15_26960 [Cyclobacteriaceae bacterium]